MAVNHPTLERLRDVLSYDPSTGDFRWLKLAKKVSRASIGGIAGNLNNRGYWRITIDRNAYPAHRLAWLYVHGYWPDPGIPIDHINGIKTDNRIANLRLVGHQENRQNLKPENVRKSKSGFLGVILCPGCVARWQARIFVDKRRICLGNFDSPEEAHAAYMEAKRRLHAGYVETKAP